MALLKSGGEIALELAGRMRRIRLSKGWSQAEVAARAGVPLPTYRVFELHGKGSLERFLRVAIALRRAHEFDAILDVAESIDDLERDRPERKRGRSVSL
jgi:transcriptional regulator with XRE-family HTH domain